MLSPPTRYEWEDQHGSRHQICQHEGGEHGDPLMLLLFCLAVHNLVTVIKDQLRPGEYVLAFLDDIYVVSLPERTRAIFNLVAEKLGECAGVELHQAKPGCGTGRAIVLRYGGTWSRRHAVCVARLAEEDKLWNQVDPFLICNALGRSLSSVQAPDATLQDLASV